jgi:hypothetical protein
MTSTPSSAVTLALPVAAGFRDGFGFAGSGAGVTALAASAGELFFAFAASFVPAQTGDTHTTANRKLQSQLFRVIKEYCFS